MKIAINPDTLTWAMKRSNREDLVGSSRRLDEWLSGRDKPTLKQLEQFAKKTHTPLPMLLMERPPEEKLPIADFRSLSGKSISPSANILDTIYLCQTRQAWYRDFCQRERTPRLPFVGRFKITDDVIEAADFITEYFDLQRYAFPTIQKAFSWRRDRLEDKGVLVMSSGMVGSHTRRTLDVREFRGFALSDDLAPIVFINSKDSQTARMFTLFHELAHILLGASGVSDAQPGSSTQKTETWCNRVAGNVLLPGDVLKQRYEEREEVMENAHRLADQVKVSTLVVLNRLKEDHFISEKDFWKYFDVEYKRMETVLAEKKRQGGGDFYNSKMAALGKRFSQALTYSTLEGTTLYRDAMNMMGIKSIKTFNQIAQRFHGWV